MEITEVRVKLTEDSDDRLQAFCSITFDDSFVVRDLKIIEGTNGPFVAMPSRKLTSHCGKCGSKNHLRAHFCNQCGAKTHAERAARDQDGRVKLYADIAHPINSACREMIQDRVIAEYQKEVELSQQPGYVSRYEDDYDYDDDDDFAEVDLLDEPATAQRPKSSVQKTEIQPPVNEPRAPHGTSGRRSDSQERQGTPHSKTRESDNFGAGIFDE
jgi:stage V sporulation protein G